MQKKGFFQRLKVENLLKKDVKLVEKKKILFLIPLGIVIAALIAMGIFWGVTGSPLNLGMDFTGGYTIQINAGTTINESNFDEYKTTVETLLKDYTYEYEDGNKYPINPGQIKRLGSGSETSMQIPYRADSSVPKANRDEIMALIAEDLVEVLNELVGYITPTTVAQSVKTFTVTYDVPVKAYIESGLLSQNLTKAGIASSALDLTNNNRTVTFTVTDDSDADAVRTAMKIADPYAAEAKATDMISGSVSAELIINAVMAVLIALVLMLIYIVIRFEFASGIAAVIALLHDMIIMFACMILFHVEFNSTFIACLITILGYSINNAIIIFDRVRENRRVMLEKNKNTTSAQVVNRSVVESLGRCIYSSLTTFIMISMVAIVCAIAGVTDMVTFAAPIMIGLLAALFSSTCIGPSLWSIFRKNNLSYQRAKFFAKKQASEDSAAAVPVPAPASVPAAPAGEAEQ